MPEDGAVAADVLDTNEALDILFESTREDLVTATIAGLDTKR